MKIEKKRQIKVGRSICRSLMRIGAKKKDLIKDLKFRKFPLDRIDIILMSLEIDKLKKKLSKLGVAKK